MKLSSQQEQRYRLTASNVAAYFKHRCDRNFRWNTVEAVFRMKPGIGWNVPRRRREHSRPGDPRRRGRASRRRLQAGDIAGQPLPQIEGRVFHRLIPRLRVFGRSCARAYRRVHCARWMSTRKS